MARPLTFVVAGLLAVLLVVGSVPIARAQPEAPGPDAQDRGDFWKHVVSPHAEEVEAVLAKAAGNYGQSQGSWGFDGDGTGSYRQRLLEDALGMLRYARRLDPDHLEVLLLLGRVADDLGRVELSRDALLGFLARQDPERIPADVFVRLGRAHLRRREYDAAAHWLRQALTSSNPQYAAQAMFYLGQVLQATGRTGDAIELLAGAVKRTQTFWGTEVVLVGFTLAVAYDKDEQISEAYAVLDAMQGQHGQGFVQAVQQALLQAQFVPAIDLDYHQALLYESAGYLAEARTEWLHYLGGGVDARFRSRARAHLRAIDDLLARRPRPGHDAAPAPVIITP